MQIKGIVKNNAIKATVVETSVFPQCGHVSACSGFGVLQNGHSFIYRSIA